MQYIGKLSFPVSHWDTVKVCYPLWAVILAGFSFHIQNFMVHFFLYKFSSQSSKKYWNVLWIVSLVDK